MGAKPPTSSTQVARSSVDGAGAVVEGGAGASTDVAGSLSDDATGEGNAARLLKAGEMVGRYCVRGLLGEGGMGRVYLARDMTLGRSVALKVLRRKVPGASAGERFVEEARTIASLNHPHVVQLYDVGEHGGSLYLALEYVEGETLQQRLSREALGVDEVLRAGRAIADALAHAHGVGVFHCDLKPGNVILGRDGRLRVVDFGLARTESTSASGRLEGTPDWMAPEQWTPARLTDRVDVWALGLIMDRLLVGRRVAEGQGGSRGEVHGAGEGAAPNGKTAPGVGRGAGDDAAPGVGGGAAPSAGGVPDDDALPEEDTVPRASVLPRPAERRSIPSLIEHLIGRSLEREPGVRPTAREWFEALERLIEGREGGPLEEAPFRGLAAFDERHASFFFGRERELDAFLERLRVQPVLPIVGPSGAGKSSFLHAGVIPRLRARQATTVISFRPGKDPIGALARSVVVAGLGSSEAERGLFRREEADALARDLRETPTRIAARLATIAAARQSSVLVAVDQLEELFTQGASEADARCFLELLFACTDDPRDPVRVIFTLRDDFLGRVPGLGAVHVMRGLRGDDLRQAIAGPPQRCGYRFDDEGLIGEMLAEIGAGRAADLPLLQFACRALWDGRDAKRRLLLRSTYDAMGGVAGALAHHADGALEAAPPHERRLIPRLLLRLVKGTARQAVERSALLAGLPPEAEGALDRLLSARLVAQRVAPDGAVSLEIAHESLLRAWGQLARWLDESREERRLLAELEEAVQHWEKRSCRPEETWPADDLLAVRRQASKLGLELPPPVERFLAAGEQHQRALQRRAKMRLAVIAGLCGVAVVGAFGLFTKFRVTERNLGQIDLVLAPFDWVDGQLRPVETAELPGLSWRLYGAHSGNEDRPGEPLPSALISVSRRGDLSSRFERAERVEAPGGAAFLRIEGRGRAGESCPPSWVRLQNVPGYLTRGAAPSMWRIDVPTCRASASGMVTIEAGPFIYGGPGEPPTQFGEYVEPEREVDLEAYAIDRTEVSNAQYEPFARLASITGYVGHVHPANGIFARGHAPDMPAAAVDAFQAEAFCRYMGKSLPGDYQWTKAARGGLRVNGVPNPAPRRLYPWGGPLDRSCVNAGGDAEPLRWLTPVESTPCGASPYGVLNLVGNAAEWISREGQTSRDTSPLRVIRGGDVVSPWALEHTTTVFRNAREDRYFDLSLGFRCVTSKEVAP